MNLWRLQIRQMRSYVKGKMWLQGYRNSCSSIRNLPTMKSVFLQNYLTWSGEALPNLTSKFTFCRPTKNLTSGTVSRSQLCFIEGGTQSRGLWTEMNRAWLNSLTLAQKFKLRIKTCKSYKILSHLLSKTRTKIKSTSLREPLTPWNILDNRRSWTK